MFRDVPVTLGDSLTADEFGDSWHAAMMHDAMCGMSVVVHIMVSVPLKLQHITSP